MKKRIIALLMAFVMMASFVSNANAVGSIWFVAVNDRIPMSMSADVMPLLEGGKLYIPYTALDVRPFDVVTSYSAANKTLTLFTLSKRLFYDLAQKTITDKEGNVTNVEIKYRNGVLYVPADGMEYFGISAKMLINDDGYVVLRFTNGAQVYNDDLFMTHAEPLILKKIEDNNAGPISPENEGPEQKPDDPTPIEPPVETENAAYLAFYGDAISETSLEILENKGLHGAFFLTHEQILQDPVLVRKLYAAGNTVGLLLTGEEEDPQTALDAANAALDDVLFRKTLLVLSLTGSGQEVAGYRVTRAPSNGTTVDNGSDRQFFVTDEENIYLTVSRLQNENIHILPLRENSQIT